MPTGVPNYLTIDPNTGDVTAFFSGGLRLLEAVAGFSDNRSVLWTRESDGLKVGRLAVVDNGSVVAPTHIMTIRTSKPLADNNPNQTYAEITERIDDYAPDAARVDVSVRVNPVLRTNTLLDGLGISDYIQKQNFIQVPIDGFGAAPTGNFTVNRPGPVFIFWQGTAYSGAVVIRYIDLQVDGVSIDSSGKFVNVINNHETYPWCCYASPSLAVGVHSVSVIAGLSGSVRDANDWSSVAVVQP